MKTVHTPPARTTALSVPVFVDVYITTVLRRRPLWKAATVCDYLATTSVKVQHLIDNGQLVWAWDIGAPSNRARKEIRILSYCAVERVHGLIKSIGPTANLKFSDVVEVILPHHRPSLRGTEIQRLLSCTAQHIADLDRNGGLMLIREPRPQSVPCASPQYTRESVVRFLEKRRII